jgi:hypothetical protein
MARAKVVELTAEKIEKLKAWYAAKSSADAFKDSEFQLRTQVVSEAGFTADKVTGSETISLQNWPGWKLQAKKVQTYKLERDTTIAFLNALGPLNVELANKIVKWEPVLSESIYKNELLPWIASLDVNDPTVQNLRALLAAALTVKPGAVQLALLPPTEEPASPEVQATS